MRLCLLFILTCYSLMSVANPPPGSHFLVFQVVQDEFTLDNSTVKNAAMIENEAKAYIGLNIELKPEAANMWKEITTAGTGRKLNLVFNQVIVTATVLAGPLNGNFLISGISREDAQAFLNVLNKNKLAKQPAQS